jgi:hypothetical protein
MRYAAGFIVLAAVLAAADTIPEGMVRPQYLESGELARPEGYREWVFVGASLGLSYSENERQAGPGLFHHVYIQPEAYRHYVEHGKFPEKTMLVMENYRPGSKTSPNLHGHFEETFAGMEVALKDAERFAEGWAYFNFSTREGPLKPSARAFPKAACYDCHAEHAADDNVFVQFYPVLRDVMEKQGRRPKGENPAHQAAPDATGDKTDYSEKE